MGSSGTGSFTDYPGSGGSGPKGAGGGGGGGGSGGGGQDRCTDPLDAVRLEDVATSDYYVSNGAVPPAGLAVRVRQAMVGGRIGVEDLDETLIGLLPTAYNYLRGCMRQGHSYEGEVVGSRLTPIPTVTVDLATA